MADLRIVHTELSAAEAAVRSNNLSADKLFGALQSSKINNTKSAQIVSLTGAAWDIGAPSFGSSLGPLSFNRLSHFGGVIRQIIGTPSLVSENSKPVSQTPPLSKLKHLCVELAREVSINIKQKKKIAVIGGDHSCAIGTWHGVADALGKGNPFGMIWIDAHLDSHTPETSITGNLHGMPLATLLGYGHESLVNLVAESPVLKPEATAVIGVRSMEKGELELLQKLGVRLYFMPEIKKRGLRNVINEAQQIVTSQSAYFGISIDLDAFDPQQVPGVNTAEPEGLNVNSLLTTLEQIHTHKGFIGVEIAEFNPLNDKKHISLHVIEQLLETLFPDLIKREIYDHHLP